MSESALKPSASFVSIPIIEEQLQHSRRVVETDGGVRIRKVVHEESVLAAEPLRMTTLEVTRKHIGSEVDAPVAIRYEGDMTVFPVMIERLVTRKQLVLFEEIYVRRVQNVDHVLEPITLRREEVIIERQVAGSQEWHVEAEIRATDDRMAAIQAV